jgi:16S rRNA (cytosine1402-N4)-methyltransferase
VDPEALDLARDRLAAFGRRVVLVNASYGSLAEIASDRGIAHADGVLFDLGVSSLQLDTPSRGFSFRHDGPLDMRFGRDGATVADLLTDIEEEELVRTLREFGEEPRARRVARAIVRARQKQPIRTTGELRRVVHAALGQRRGRIDPSTRTFQALRIAVNRELESLPSALDQAARLLRPGGRLAVIAFHSLEDRLVKRALRRLSGRCVCPPGSFACQCRPDRLLEVLTPKPVTPGPEELADNPRARSAKLRVAARRSE